MKTMKDNCTMAWVWVVLSTTSLLDDNYSAAAAVSKDKLESLVSRSGYKPVTQQNIMRNSANITSATSPDSLMKYSYRYFIITH